jgi:hypothetical protein
MVGAELVPIEGEEEKQLLLLCEFQRNSIPFLPPLDIIDIIDKSGDPFTCTF